MSCYSFSCPWLQWLLKFQRKEILTICLWKLHAVFCKSQEERRLRWGKMNKCNPLIDKLFSKFACLKVIFLSDSNHYLWLCKKYIKWSSVVWIINMFVSGRLTCIARTSAAHVPLTTAPLPTCSSWLRGMEKVGKRELVRIYNELCCVDVIGRQRCLVMRELGGEKVSGLLGFESKDK